MTSEMTSSGLSGSIRIGYMTNVTLFDIPRLLGRFSDDHPDVTMRLVPAAAGTAGLADGLRGGDLDLAFLAATPEDYPDLRIEVLARSLLGLAVAASDPLAGAAASCGSSTSTRGSPTALWSTPSSGAAACGTKCRSRHPT
jgi:DNA-binding transcriptional LysR family regulator